MNAINWSPIFFEIVDRVDNMAYYRPDHSHRRVMKPQQKEEPYIHLDSSGVIQRKNERILCAGFFENGNLSSWVQRETKISRGCIECIQKCEVHELYAVLPNVKFCYFILYQKHLWLVASEATGAMLWDEEDTPTVGAAIEKLIEQVMFVPESGSQYHAANEAFKDHIL